MNFDPETGKPIENAQPQTPVQPKKSNGVAIAGFVLALIGGFLLDIVGLILSIVGLNKSKECNSGKGLAIAGIIIAIVKLILGIIIIIACWGLILAAFGIVASYEEYCSNPATVCSEVVDGTAECKYKDGSVTYTITCPSNLINKRTTEPTTTTTTTAKASTKGEVAEYKLDAEDGPKYYADIVYLKDNNLYGHITDDYASKVKSDYTMNGKKAALLIQNVAKVWTPEFGQGGYQDVIFTDLRGDVYRLNNIPSDITERKNETALGMTKLNVKDAKDVYTLGTDGAWDYVIINSKNQIIYSDLEEYSTYLYFDKKNNRGENLIGSDVYKLEIDKTEKGSEDTTVIYFNVYKNGSKLSDQVKYEFLGTFSDYETVGLIPIRRCKSGSDLAFESKCE